MLVKIPWLEFVEKIRLWNITPLSLTRVIREVKGDTLIFYLPTPEADYCTVIHKDDMTGVINMLLDALSIEGQLITDDRKLDDINRRLTNIENNIETTKKAGLFDN